MKRLIRSAALLCLLGMLFYMPATVQAGIYKCIDRNGATTYSQTACPVQEQTANVITTYTSSVAPQDCGIAWNFTQQTTKQMKGGMTSGSVFDQYGGIDSISGTAIAMINYIYTYKHDPQVSIDRITSLTTARCKAGSFGKMSCDRFPHNFIADLGGCEGATIPGGRRMYDDGGYAANTARQQPSTQYLSQHALAAANTEAAIDAGADQPASMSVDQASMCKHRIASQLDGIAGQMRQRLSAQQQSSLRDRQRTLRKQLGNC
jgi:hypothetical protein